MPQPLHQWLVRLATGVALLWLVIGTVGMGRAARYVGDLFPGFVWSPGGPAPFVPVMEMVRLSESPWWGGIADEVVPASKIVAVNGRSVASMPDFGPMAEGDPVTFTLRLPDGTLKNVTVPLRQFTSAHYFEFYGLFFLIGLTNTFVGLILVRRAADMPAFLLGGAHLAFGGMGLQHSAGGCISTCTWTELFFARLAGFLAYSPSLLLSAIIFTYFGLLYPRPLLSPRRMKQAVKFMIVLAISMVVLTASREIRTRSFAAWEFFSQLGWVAIGAAMLVVRSGYATLVRRAPESESLMLGWALVGGIALALLGGVLPFLNVVPIWFITSLIYPTSIIYPLVILYAVRNMALLHALTEALNHVRGLEQEVQEQKRAHARALSQMADILHDSVLGDLKGVQFLTRAATRRLQHQDLRALQEDLEFLDRTLHELAGQLRGVMEGMQPANFEGEGVVRILERLFEARRRMYGDELHVGFSVDPRYDMLPTSLQEQVYWIVRAALDNTRDHAQATRFEATLSCTPEEDGFRFVMCLRDNGVGFDEQAMRPVAVSRGQYGLRNMRRRAEQKLGGRIRFESSDGTTIVVEFTYKGPEGEEQNGVVHKSQKGPKLLKRWHGERRSA
ncbi:MAG: hypothetical protein Q9O62_00910 [Ardenticatenia bacterium]|nr:hypothetical protein [Ardenticatenia bacterium]